MKFDNFTLKRHPIKLIFYFWLFTCIFFLNIFFKSNLDKYLSFPLLRGRVINADFAHTSDKINV